jgi:hypothetical protein
MAMATLPTKYLRTSYLMIRYLLLLVFFLAAAGSGAEETTIYRSKNDQGATVFSDRAEDNSEAVELRQSTTYSPAKYAREYEGFSPAEKDQTASRFRYSQLTVVSPAADEVIRDNTGNIAVSVQLEPGPVPGHQVQLLMDGKVIQTLLNSGDVSLANVDRGTHQLQLQVIDSKTDKVIQSSNTSKFTLHRFSAKHRSSN